MIFEKFIEFSDQKLQLKWLLKLSTSLVLTQPPKTQITDMVSKLTTCSIDLITFTKRSEFSEYLFNLGKPSLFHCISSNTYPKGINFKFRATLLSLWTQTKAKVLLKYFTSDSYKIDIIIMWLSMIKHWFYQICWICLKKRCHLKSENSNKLFLFTQFKHQCCG